MPEAITLALDVMGGDHAPDAVLQGADQVARNQPKVSFRLYGDQAVIEPALRKLPALDKQSVIKHTDSAVHNDDKPTMAIRQKRNSSMGLAIRAVRRGKADGVVSAGNTGALMAMAKVMLGTIPGIDRPAIAALVPTMKDNCVMLDLGANILCDANNLYEFAIMGDAFARAVLGKSSPSIGLLNIGTEEMKGNEAVKEAAQMIREAELDLNYYGHVEGSDIGKGVVDVIVTDGFNGNVALKTAEGTARVCHKFIKDAFASSPISKLGAVLARSALQEVAQKLDTRLLNGAMFVGLNGVVIKSHGGMDEVGLANAIELAVKLARDNINQRIREEMRQVGHSPADMMDDDEFQDDDV